MPHRKNAKGDIGTAKKWSDSYDADNIYLSEEGWVYRHFKNTDRTLWWDEILVAGQVVPDKEIHGVSNGAGYLEEKTGYNEGVCETNPYKLGTVDDVAFQTGDGVNDYRYSDHTYRVSDDSMVTMEKVDTLGGEMKSDSYSATGFDQIAWTSINVDESAVVEGDLSTQIPAGWDTVDVVEGVTKPHNDTLYAYPDDSVNAGPELENYYTVAPDTMPGVPPYIIMGDFDTVAPGGYADKVPATGDDKPAEEDNWEDTTASSDGTDQIPVPIIPIV